MVKGEYVNTPRFCQVYIQEVFDTESDARRAGYTEPTHYENNFYGVLGKSMDMYHMKFAGYKKWIPEEYLGEENLCDLHGCCDEWVLEHFKDGDIAIIWNTFNDDLNKVCLVHCYIRRDNKFVDVRGSTSNEADIEEGFEDFVWDDSGRLYCKSLEEFKSAIRKICGYTDQKWQ